MGSENWFPFRTAHREDLDMHFLDMIRIYLFGAALERNDVETAFIFDFSVWIPSAFSTATCKNVLHVRFCLYYVEENLLEVHGGKGTR